MSLVACLNFKKSRVSALSMFHVAVGNLTKGCRLSRFHLSVVAAFWVMSLVGGYPGRDSLVIGNIFLHFLKKPTIKNLVWSFFCTWCLIKLDRAIVK